MDPQPDNIDQIAAAILAALPQARTVSAVPSGSGCGDAPMIERGALGDKPDEVTVLERRVLAHERILLALIGHLCDDDAEILNQLKTRFGRGHDLGTYEQDFTSTEHYSEQFIRRVEGEVDRRQR
jgi:hypothetical protein